MSHAGTRDIYPFGKDTHKNMNKCAISLWFYAEGSKISDLSFSKFTLKSSLDIFDYNLNSFTLTILFSDGLVKSSQGNLVLNGNKIGSFDIIEGSWAHMLVIWDNKKNLSDGKSIRIYINGNEVMSSKSDLPDFSDFSMKFQIKNETESINNVEVTSFFCIDNIQIWNDVVTEDPNIFYNNGYGREDALHAIYGPENGYKPSNVGVGYHYVR